MFVTSEGDSGIFTSSYHSDQGGDNIMRLSVSQSFGKSFPDINEDNEVTDGQDDDEGSMVETQVKMPTPSMSSSFTASSPAPAKPKRSMITSYSNTNLQRQCTASSVRARVQLFESMSGKMIPTKQRQQQHRVPANTSNGGQTQARQTASEGVSRKNAQQQQPQMSASASPKPASTPPTLSSSTPAPIMSISSSSSATSCGYKDFLIDDDYIDQQQLTFSK